MAKSILPWLDEHYYKGYSFTKPEYEPSDKPDEYHSGDYILFDDKKFEETYCTVWTSGNEAGNLKDYKMSGEKTFFQSAYQATVAVSADLHKNGGEVIPAFGGFLDAGFNHYHHGIPSPWLEFHFKDDSATFVSTFYSNYPAGDYDITPVSTLAKQLPGMDYMTFCPDKGCVLALSSPGISGDGFTLYGMIQHLNDHHKWTRDEIADWVETLDCDINFKTKEIA